MLSASATLTSVAPSITWLLVSTRPDGDRIIPVPSAVSLAYASVEVMSTRPGLTFRTTAAWFSADPDPLPAWSSCGDGMSLEETPAVGLDPEPANATVSPAPIPAASAATVRYTSRCPRRRPAAAPDPTRPSQTRPRTRPSQTRPRTRPSQTHRPPSRTSRPSPYPPLPEP